MNWKLWMALLVAVAASASAYVEKTQESPSNDGEKAGKLNPYTEGAKQARRDPYTEGARRGKFDPYTEGARRGKFDPYTEGAKQRAHTETRDPDIDGANSK